MIAEPLWLTEARKHIGVREIPGVNHHHLIVAMWKAIKRGGIRDDETPWCAAFVGFCLEGAGIVSSRFESAKSYMTWGRALPGPCTAASWCSRAKVVAMSGSSRARTVRAACWFWRQPGQRSEHSCLPARSREWLPMAAGRAVAGYGFGDR